MDYFDNILGLIGRTPLVKLNKLTRGLSPLVLAKVESRNPGGSIKDRIGIAMIERAERAGQLKPGGTVVEATSGNTGIGIALAAAIKGYRCVFVMTDKCSQEKVRYLKALGSRVDPGEAFRRLDLDRDGNIDIGEMEQLYMQYVISDNPGEPGNYLVTGTVD